MGEKIIEKISNELVELANEGKKSMLIVYNKNNELSLNLVSDRKLIPEDYIVGEINLEIDNTYEDIKDEINDMTLRYVLKI